MLSGRRGRVATLLLSTASTVLLAARWQVGATTDGPHKAFLWFGLSAFVAGAVIQVHSLVQGRAKAAFYRYASERLRQFRIDNLERGEAGEFPTEELELTLLVRKSPSYLEKRKLKSNGQSVGPFFRVAARASRPSRDSSAMIPAGEGLVHYAASRSVATYKSLDRAYNWPDDAAAYAESHKLSEQTARTLSRFPAEFLLCPIGLVPDPSGEQMRRAGADPRAREANAVISVCYPEPRAIARFSAGDTSAETVSGDLLTALNEMAEEFRVRWEEFHGADVA